MKIDKKININGLVAGLMLLGFIFLFLHSETNLFDKHTEHCASVDVCLILNKAIFEKSHQTIKQITISFDYFLDPILIGYSNPFLSLYLQKNPEFDCRKNFKTYIRYSSLLI